MRPIQPSLFLAPAKLDSGRAQERDGRSRPGRGPYGFGQVRTRQILWHRHPADDAWLEEAPNAEFCVGDPEPMPRSSRAHRVKPNPYQAPGTLRSR
jgi:hypothetical protein